jgi:hypothetical protein
MFPNTAGTVIIASANSFTKSLAKQLLQGPETQSLCSRIS